VAAAVVGTAVDVFVVFCACLCGTTCVSEKPDDQGSESNNWYEKLLENSIVVAADSKSCKVEYRRAE